MSVKKEKGDNCFNWDDYVTLRDYFESKINLLQNEVKIRIDALKEATDIAKSAMDERLARMNEFRDTLKDQNATFITKSEFLAYQDRISSQFKDNDKAIADLRTSRDEARGKASQNQVLIAYVFAIVSIVLSVALHFLPI